MKNVWIFVCIMLWSSTLFAQEKEAYTFRDYSEMRAEFGKLFQRKEYEKAAEMIEWALPKYPGHVHANSFNLAFVYLNLKNYEKSMAALEYGHEHGAWFNIYLLEDDGFKPVRETVRFKKIKAKNEEIRLEIQKNTRPDMLVVTPEGYDPDREYPLFLALHGGSSNAMAFRDIWISDKMKKEFIIVYLQSSRIVAPDGYSWTVDLDISRKEIEDACKKVFKEYPVNKKLVIIGGFSAGGAASIESVLYDVAPFTGFIILCPPESEGVNMDRIREAQKRGVQGVILATEMDPGLPFQKKLDRIMTEAGLRHKFIIAPDTGHWFPSDFKEQLDSAIEFIMEK